MEQIAAAETSKSLNVNSAMKVAGERENEMQEVFKLMDSDQLQIRARTGFSSYDPFENGNYDRPVASVETVSIFGQTPSTRREVLGWGNFSGIVMIDSENRSRDILTNTGFQGWCNIAIRARNKKTNKIDIGLAHIYPEKDGYSLSEILRKTQGELEEDNYDTVEYFVAYETTKVKWMIKKTYEEFEQFVQKSFQEQHPNIKIRFQSRDEDSSQYIAVDQNGVAISKDGQLTILDWQANDHAQLISTPGGIDLTAKQMDLEVEKDKGMVSQSMDIKAFEGIEINSLYIKDIEIKPLKHLPQILGIPSSASS